MKGVEWTGGTRSGGIVTDVEEVEHDMKAPRGHYPVDSHGGPQNKLVALIKTGAV
ncbi:uncharacterized protein FFB14_11882 [Fusarium fujikuroi]|nr:uncharacterized protein FFB14_11882 [Fusarium fujikuroi]